MILYNYSEDTHEYLGTQEAYIDPEESLVQGKTVYMIPANATDIKPPIKKDNSVYCYENNKWIAVIDFRGRRIVNSDFTDFDTVQKLGPLDNNYCLITTEQEDKIKEDVLFYKWTPQGLIKNPNYEKEKSDKERLARIEEIKQELDSIDLKSIRCLRAGERDYLDKYEKEAIALREELKKLQKEIGVI